MQTTSDSRRSPRTSRFLLTVLVSALASSCRLVSTAVQAPVKATSAVLGGGEKKKEEQVPPNLLQAGVMRFADTFAARIAQATTDFTQATGTIDGRIQALTWQVGPTTSAFTIASGPNATLNVLDMVVLVTLGRMTHEDHWSTVYGDADKPMLDAYTKLEDEIWGIARQTLNEHHQEAVRQVLTEWREENPDIASTGFMRLPAFEDLIKSSKKGTPGMLDELSGMLTLDPLSGLEPATREIEKTRLFAERTLFYMQRAPLLLSAQVELLTLKLSRQPDVQTAVAATERISLAAEEVSKNAAGLPGLVHDEREAAITQISDELTKQRQGLIDDLGKAQAPVGQVLAQARDAMTAGTQMSTAVQGAVESLDKFIGRFDKKPEPNAPPAPPKPPGKPFDVADYGKAASDVGGAARDLTQLLTAVDGSVPKLQSAADQLVQRSERTIDLAYQRGMMLGVALIAAAAVAVLGVRWISSRWLARA